MNRSTLDKVRKRWLALIVVVGGLAVPASSPGTSVTATATVSGSALNVSSSATPSFTANLDSGDGTPAYSVPLATQDTAGTGAGWNETVTSTQFTTGAPQSYTLPATASTVTAVTAAGGSGTNTAPTDLITYPVSVPAASAAPAPVKIFDATADTGMGRFIITPTISVFVPQDSYSGTYTSTLTLGIVSGP